MANRPLMIAILASAVMVRADEWRLPEREAYVSANKYWRLVITPKRLQSQLAYFEDKTIGKDNAGAARSVSDNYAKATLYRKNRFGRWRQAAHWRLVNEVSPVSALVANDGTVVTFDNWHMMGYGEDVIVIYRADGTLVRKLGLADLLVEDDLSELRRSVSSIWWSGEHRIDEAHRRVILQVHAVQTEELPVSLDSGTLLVPKRALFPSPTVSWSAEDAVDADCKDAIALSGTEVSRLLIRGDVPKYPTVARKARISGSVVVSARIDAAGNVTAVAVLKSLPFGLDQAARETVATWEFRPLERTGTPVSSCARIRLTFDLRR